MELSHATDDHFLCLFVYIYEEGGILSFEFWYCFLEFCLSVWFCWLYCETHDWVWDEHALATSWETVVGLTKSISCWTVYSKNGKDISGFDLIYLFHRVGMHFNDSRDFQFFSKFIIPYKLTSF